MSVDSRLGSIEVAISAMNQKLGDHTKQDDANFGRISNQVSVMDEKIDQLLLREATREGEAKGTRKMAAIIAGAISFLITGVGFYLNHVG